MKKLFLLIFVLLLAFPGIARDFTFQYEGQTLTYTVISEEDKTCQTKSGQSMSAGSAWQYPSAGNKVSGKLVIPSVINDGESDYIVTSIGDYAFYDCSGLTEAIIPNSVTSIGNSAFWSCSGLTQVTIPNSVTSIGDWAFDSCSGLTEITIPNSVTSISNGTFSNCSGLTQMVIPSSIYSIGNYAFYNCSGLYQVIIPNSVTSIGDWAFSSCSLLTKMIIPNSVTSIGIKAFKDCISLSRVTIGNSVVSIGNQAFYWCHNLTEVTIPNSVTSIGAGAFADCSRLSEVTIPNSVTFIGKDAFLGCNGLQKANFESLENLFKIEFDNSFSNPLCYGHNLYINGKEVKSLDIPNTVTSIGNYALYNCKLLTEVIIPNSVTSIGYAAFAECSSLTEVRLPNSVTSIDGAAFYNCSDLTEVIIPNSVTSIGGGAFSCCSSLTEVIIPNSVTSIGGEAFSECSGLTEVIIPNSVTSIGGGAFSCCSSLTDVTIGNSVTFIGNSAFLECNGLKKVTIGTSVTTIDNYAFYGCSSLSELICKAVAPPTIYIRTFDDCNYENAKLFVGKDVISDYKENPEWGQFVNIAAYDINVESITLDTDKYEAKPNTQFQLTATILPDDAYYERLEWASSDESVATVDQTGLVTTHKSGTAQIIVKVINNEEIMAACDVTVVKYNQTIEWEQEFDGVRVGDEIELTASSSSNLPIVYTSSDEEIAEINGNIITFKSVGEVEITATQPGNENYEAAESISKTITVMPVLTEEITINTTKLILEIGDTYQLKASVHPENVTTNGLIWESSDSDIVTVSENGFVTAVDSGSASIIVKAVDDSGVSACCDITVNKPAGIEKTYINTKCSIYAKNGSLYVTGLSEGQRIEIYSFDGVCIYTGTRHIVPLHKGTFIVKVNNITKKVII